MMEAQTVAMLLSVGAGALAGIASAFTLLNTARALRAKHRVHSLLRREAVMDSYVRGLMLEVSAIDGLNDDEMKKIIQMIERKMTVLPQHDQKLIEEGLRQGSRQGIQRFVREIAAA